MYKKALDENVKGRCEKGTYMKIFNKIGLGSPRNVLCKRNKLKNKCMMIKQPFNPE